MRFRSSLGSHTDTLALRWDAEWSPHFFTGVEYQHQDCEPQPPHRQHVRRLWRSAKRGSTGSPPRPISGWARHRCVRHVGTTETDIRSGEAIRRDVPVHCRSVRARRRHLRSPEPDQADTRHHLCGRAHRRPDRRRLRITGRRMRPLRGRRPIAAFSWASRFLTSSMQIMRSRPAIPGPDAGGRRDRGGAFLIVDKAGPLRGMVREHDLAAPRRRHIGGRACCCRFPPCEASSSSRLASTISIPPSARRDLTSPALVVAIDEPSFAEIGQRWPWSRELHARLIDKLRQAGAKVVGFDIIFAEPRAESADAAFAKALGPDVILAADLVVDPPRSRRAGHPG